MRVVGAFLLYLVHRAATEAACCCTSKSVSPRGVRSRHCRSGGFPLFRRRAGSILFGEASWRQAPTVPTGAPPFEAFPSRSAHPRQPHPVSARRRSVALEKLERASLLARWSSTGCGPPQILPSRRWSWSTSRLMLRKRSDAAPGPFPRPQGLDPSASPLRSSALQPPTTRYSLGLRPSKVCSNAAVSVACAGELATGVAAHGTRVSRHPRAETSWRGCTEVQQHQSICPDRANNAQ